MTPPQPSPLEALQRWLAQLITDNGTNRLRRVEQAIAQVVRKDNGKHLRGLLVADDLCLTRRRTFFRINGTLAEEVSLEEVAANYNLTAMQEKYRAATDAWKNAQRRRA